MSPSPPRGTRAGRSQNRRGIALFVTLAGAGAALLVFGTSPTTALTSTSPAPAAQAASALGETSQVSAPADVLPPAAPAAAVPAAPLAAAAPAAQPKSQAGVSTAQQPAKAQAPAKAPEMGAAEHPMPSSTDSCAGLQAAVDAFLMHLNAAHLETSPGQQVTEALSVDQYVKTHTVLVENMITPLGAGGDDALGICLQRVYAAHLEASPGQQVADLLAVDQYVKTHTVLVENMLAPLAGTDTSSC